MNDAAMQPATPTLHPSSLEPPTRVDQLPGQGELPKPRLVHSKSQSGNEGEPFNLQARVFPNNPSREAPSSARLLAAKEGHPLTTKGEIDGPQETGLHSAPGVGGGWVLLLPQVRHARPRGFWRSGRAPKD